MTILLEKLSKEYQYLEAENKWLRDEVIRYRQSLLEHHNVAHLSEEAIRESIGGPCQVCAKAQKIFLPREEYSL